MSRRAAVRSGTWLYQQERMAVRLLVLGIGRPILLLLAYLGAHDRDGP